MWCLRKGYGDNPLEVWNNTSKSYNNQWCTVTMVVAPGGYTTLYVNGEVLTHSSSSDIPKITNVLNYISSYVYVWPFISALFVRRIAQLMNLPAMQETPVLFLGQEDPLEKG